MSRTLRFPPTHVDVCKVTAKQAPDTPNVVELMPLGYPPDKPKPKQRLALDQIVCHEEWG